MKYFTVILTLCAVLGLGAWATADNNDDACPPPTTCDSGTSLDSLTGECVAPADVYSEEEVDW